MSRGSSTWLWYLQEGGAARQRGREGSSTVNAAEHGRAGVRACGRAGVRACGRAGAGMTGIAAYTQATLLSSWGPGPLSGGTFGKGEGDR